MSYLKKKKLFRDLDKKMQEVDVGPVKVHLFCHRLSRSTYYRIRKGGNINMETFLDVCEFIGKNPRRYFKKNLPKK